MCLVKMYIKKLIHFPKKQYKIVLKYFFFDMREFNFWFTHNKKNILNTNTRRKTILFYEKTNIAIHTDSKTLLKNEMKIIKLILAKNYISYGMIIREN